MPKKLIEVALPLEPINKLSAEEKSVPRHGHPQTLHLWWARRPLAACRAVIFASLVDDPSSFPEKFPSEEEQNAERQRLFDIMERVIKWDNSSNEGFLEEAWKEICKSTNDSPPSVYDPFCGGGSIPLEAQRLGLDAKGSDINPVAVLITKALIEIPPIFVNTPPVNPKIKSDLLCSPVWKFACGIAEDIRYYGKWINEEVKRRIGNYYPPITLPTEYGSTKLPVLAWQWARTVKCPNPACGIMMPLVRSFILSQKGKNKTWIAPIIDRSSKTIDFKVRNGETDLPGGTVNRTGATCILCNTFVPFDYIRTEGRAKRISAKLLAVVAESQAGRIYLPPSKEQEDLASKAIPTWIPETDLPEQALGFRIQLYGMTKHKDLFTSRQLLTLTTFCDLINEVWESIRSDAVSAGLPDKGFRLIDKTVSASAYADALTVYLSCALSRLASYNNTICFWNVKGGSITQIFARHAISMSWDFMETNPLEKMSGNWMGAIEWVSDVLDDLVVKRPGTVEQTDAASLNVKSEVCISTDPPYYDQIGYADLSDFFYIWLRYTLNKIYPDIFSTVLTIKAKELIAAPHRFNGDKKQAQQFFEDGLIKAFSNMRAVQHQEYPLTVYYAFKQTEAEENELNQEDNISLVASTGWETMLNGLIQSGFTINGTWPIRTERAGRPRDIRSNALASSIVLVCRPRPTNSYTATRREFINALKKELPDALKKLQQGNIAPVDLAQASIGPGMAIYSRYSQVLESDGTPMPVRTALGLINHALDEYLSEQEGEFDADTRWALAWFETVGMEEGAFGIAETLSKAKNTGIDGLKRAGILEAKSGKVRLLRREELLKDWDPATDKRITTWEATQYLIRAIDEKGETGAAQLLNKLGGLGDVARDLAYRLYSICERKKWAQEAMAYNGLVIAWPEIVKLASQTRIEEQPSLF